MTHHPLPVNQRQQRGVDRPKVIKPRDPVMAAYRRTVALDLSNEARRDFMSVFNLVRNAELEGRDTYGFYTAYSANPGDGLALAAYLEAVASTREPGWAE